MTPIHLPRRHSPTHAPERRLRYLPTEGRWTERGPADLRTGTVLTGLGLLLSGSAAALALADHSDAASLPLILGSGLLLTGLVMLLVDSGAKLARRLSRIKKHCGCCRHYQAQPNQYALGRCQLDTDGQVVQRTAGCPHFCHSPRAMVRDRLSQRPEVLEGIRVL